MRVKMAVSLCSEIPIISTTLVAHLEHTTLPRMGAVKVILDTLGPRTEEVKEQSTIHKSLSGASIKLIKDTFGAIREKKYVKETRPPIQYVLDVTIAYPNAHALSLGTLVFGNRENCDIAVNYRMFKVEEVPYHDEILLRDWMYKVYEEKDKLLDHYYKHGTFEAGKEGKKIVFPWSRIIGQYAFWFSGMLKLDCKNIRTFSLLRANQTVFIYPHDTVPVLLSAACVISQLYYC
jgi:lysophosphatidylglycerol acyltransferase 1